MTDEQHEKITKTITIHYKPELATSPEVIHCNQERSGYTLSGDGDVPTYRVYAGRRTILIPVDNVLKIDMLL